MDQRFAHLEQRYQKCARSMLELCHRTASKHVSSSLSCLEILVDLAFSRMAPHDDVLLSKGHAAPAIYSVLAEKGLISDSDLQTYGSEGSRFPIHPGCHSSGNLVPGIPFGTGSLGHGLSLAAGMALGRKWRGAPGKLFCIVSDGECQAGSTWEAALFAAHHRLSELTVIVDANGLQAFGNTEEVLGIEPLADKWRNFGFLVEVAEQGQSFESLENAHQRLSHPQRSDDSTRPRCLIARTIKGGRISFMQNRLEWHYLPVTDQDLQRALSELDEIRMRGSHAS